MRETFPDQQPPKNLRPIGIKLDVETLNALNTLAALGQFQDRSDLMRQMLEFAWPTFYKRVMARVAAAASRQPYAVSKAEAESAALEISSQWTRGDAVPLYPLDIFGPRGKALLSLLQSAWPPEEIPTAAEVSKIFQKFQERLDTAAPTFKAGPRPRSPSRSEPKDLPETLPAGDGIRPKQPRRSVS